MSKKRNSQSESSKLIESFEFSNNKGEITDKPSTKMAESHESVKVTDSVNVNENKLTDFIDEEKNLTCKHSWSDLMDDEVASKAYISNVIIGNLYRWL